MHYDPNKHHRRSIRLKQYDYAHAGAYFVTVVTQNRICSFGDVVNGEMRTNEFGEIVARTWNDLPNHNPHVILDAFVVMPNHVHGIIVIVDDLFVGAGSKPAQSTTVQSGSETAPAIGKTTARRHGLQEIVRQFKTFSARRINAVRGTPGETVWQRNYYEHIIRNEPALHRIREYIRNNPVQWHLDRENVHATGTHPWETQWFPSNIP